MNHLTGNRVLAHTDSVVRVAIPKYPKPEPVPIRVVQPPALGLTVERAAVTPRRKKHDYRNVKYY